MNDQIVEQKNVDELLNALGVKLDAQTLDLLTDHVNDEIAKRVEKETLDCLDGDEEALVKYNELLDAEKYDELASWVREYFESAGESYDELLADAINMVIVDIVKHKDDL